VTVKKYLPCFDGTTFLGMRSISEPGVRGCADCYVNYADYAECDLQRREGLALMAETAAGDADVQQAFADRDALRLQVADLKKALEGLIKAARKVDISEDEWGRFIREPLNAAYRAYLADEAEVVRISVTDNAESPNTATTELRVKLKGATG
jgi:hypothetical protein